MSAARGALRWLLPALLSLGLAGCGEGLLTPLAPGSNGGPGGDAPSNGPEVLVIEDDNSVRWTRASSETGSGIAEPVPADASSSVSALIDGSVGGRLRCGRFILVVPPGAFEGIGTITMTMADTTVMVVDLEIEPAGMNEFKVPVKLCLVTEGVSVEEDDLSIYWYDPDAKDWEAMSCDRDLSKYPEVTGSAYTEGMLTNLSHFSRYVGGKAGW